MEHEPVFKAICGAVWVVQAETASSHMLNKMTHTQAQMMTDLLVACRMQQQLCMLLCCTHDVRWAWQLESCSTSCGCTAWHTKRGVCYQSSCHLAAQQQASVLVADGT